MSFHVEDMDVPFLDSSTLMVYIVEPLGGSTFWIRPGVWADKGSGHGSGFLGST